MTHMARLIVAGLALLALIATACGGDDPPQQTNEPVTATIAIGQAAAGTAETGATTAPVRTATATTAPSATSAATAAARSTVVTAATATANERVVAEDCLKGLNAYRYSGRFKIAGGAGAGALSALGSEEIKLSGAFVKPDRVQTRIEFGSQALETVTIGATTWTRFGTAAWTQAGGGGFGAGISPDDFCQDNFNNLASAGVTPVRDRTNGIATLRYEFDKRAIGRLDTLGGATAAAELPDDSRMNVWVTENERWPVKVTLKGDRTGSDPYSIDLELNVTDLNGNITINAPR